MSTVVRRTEDPNIFRSERMSYIKMYIENDAAHDVVEELGKTGLIEFKDLNPDVSGFQRTYANEIKRCDEMQRKMRVFRDLLTKADVPVPEDSLVEQITFNDLELLLSEREAELSRATSDYENLKRSLSQLREEMTVLRDCAGIYQFAPTSLGEVETMSDPFLAAEESARDNVGRVGHLSGCLAADKAELFRRVVFRITRGNCFVSFVETKDEVVDPRTGKVARKAVFMVFFAGSVIGRKIQKIAETFSASVYRFPDTGGDRERRLRELADQIVEVQTVFDRTHESRTKLLTTIASSLVANETLVAKEKAIFHTLNKFEARVQRRGMQAEGWCATNSLPEVRAAINRVSSRPNVPRPIINEVKDVKEEPPTWFRTNKFTSGFQVIVDAYGIANYQEFNPTPFTVITFPFLFAVMFGDFGHGTLMLLFALFLLAREKYFLKNPPGEIMGIFFGGRYVILLMALFSMYTGLLYNDTFALSMNLFDSPYHYEEGENGVWHFSNYYLIADPKQCPASTPLCVPIFDKKSRVYPFGIDPIWKQSDNELSFTNSLKMKMSIVFGVIQMEFGVLLSGLNHIYFRNWVSFFHEFLPQLLFMSSIFGYMVFVILLKWATYYRNTYCSPSILTLFIDMVLSGGAVNFPDGCEAGLEMFPDQSSTEKVLVLIAVISVPWMLLAKPLILRSQHAKANNKYKPTPDSDLGAGANMDPEGGASAHVHGEHEEFDFMEEMVHQVIHTIEYVLGAVSNTASYLRLWALSLAHAQLSTVFWERVMVDNIAAGNPALIVAAFMVWVCCTFAVLMVMESLSAFLHALRLHWVEFQNKFYHGAGRKFEPFLLKQPKSVE